MQAAMDRLEGFLERRRWLVLGAWLVLLLAAAPFAAQQTEHLTSGGFDVPGSQSEVVDRNLDALRGRRSARASPWSSRAARAATAAAVRAEVDRVGAARRSAAARGARPAHAAARQARRGRRLDRGGAARGATATRTRPPTSPSTCATSSTQATCAATASSPTSSGQQALWAGMQDLTKEDLETAERTGFPIVLLILLAVFGSLAAAALPLALGFASVGDSPARRSTSSPRPPTMSVFVTNVASMIGIGVAVDYSLFVLARYREEIRAGRPTGGGPPHRHAHLRARRGLLRHHRDALAGRPVPGRLDHDPLDGDGRDHRGGGLDPRRGHAAAGADAPARPARLRARPDRHARSR